MAPALVHVLTFAVLVPAVAAVETEDRLGLIFDDECGAHSPCALELLQLSHHKLPKHPKKPVPQTRSLASEAEADSDVMERYARFEELFALYNARPYPEIDEGIWTFDVPREIKVTSWSGQFWMNQRLLPKMAPNCHWSELPHGKKDITYYNGKKVPYDYEYVIHDNQTDISEYDVVLFYLPFMMRTEWRTSLPATKKEGQLWIATCAEPMLRAESMMDCSLSADPDFMQHMDGFSSYSPTSDFPAFFNTPTERQMRMSAPIFAERGDELVTLTLSDCGSPERNTFLREFIGEFAAHNKSSAVLSYGKCFHNAEEPDRKSCGEPTYEDCWANRCSSRPFKLVMENSHDPWYISEKIWDAFWEGSIPIYFGPVEAKQLLPPDSAIFAQDYDSPAAIARAILDFSEEDFTKARAWKTAPLSEWNLWQQARHDGFSTLLPRICEEAAWRQQFGGQR